MLSSTQTNVSGTSNRVFLQSNSYILARTTGVGSGAEVWVCWASASDISSGAESAASWEKIATLASDATFSKTYTGVSPTVVELRSATSADLVVKTQYTV